MRHTLLLLIIILVSCAAEAQLEVIEVDSVTRAAVKTAPFDKPFVIRTLIDAENVKRVFIIRRVGHNSLSASLAHYVSNSGSSGFVVPELEPNYFWTRKIGDKNFLFISIADDHLFKPSQSYFLLPDLKQTDPSVLAFFDAYYTYSLGGPTAAAALTNAVQSLTVFQTRMQKIFGPNLVFGFASVPVFTSSLPQFAVDFGTYLQPTYAAYEAARLAFTAGVAARVVPLTTPLAGLNTLTQKQLQADASLNKDAVAYLMGRDLQKNDLVSDLSAATRASLLPSLLDGSLSLRCLRCEAIDITSNAAADISRRISNLDSSVAAMVQLQRTLNLLTPIASGAGVPAILALLDNWITAFQTSRMQLSAMLKLRQRIEENIMDQNYAGMSFTYTQILGGNTYLNFETRNKVLLTPDFGVVTPALSSKGKDLEYGIVPYLGFHINLMAVDKDLAFKSYPKHPLQRLSIMVGWSLVNMNRDKAYANFFEKSALLTGAGFRLNNVLRVTTGAQWLFRLGVDAQGKDTRKLRGVPFVGLSFDLNLKQYLNGFVDLLSGIGKTKAADALTEISK